MWRVDLKNRKLLPEDCNLGTLKRNVQSVTIDPDDKFFYCGTTTGDILKINFETKLLVRVFNVNVSMSRAATRPYQH